MRNYCLGLGEKHFVRKLKWQVEDGFYNDIYEYDYYLNIINDIRNFFELMKKKINIIKRILILI